MTLHVVKFSEIADVHVGDLIVDHPFGTFEIGDAVRSFDPRDQHDRKVIEVRSISHRLSCGGRHVNATLCYTGPVALALSDKE